ncbi:MAG: efflux RND transporter periplasmic adaptor subunit [Nitrospiraceae bacterium]|nr:efflux RND transporter periplasmic adaptor subunit [Nitrospiraceae bacterium]
MKKSWVVLLAALSVAALVSSCGGKIGPGSVKVQRRTVEGVKTGVVRLMTVPSFYRTSGMIESRNSSLVAAKVMGAVTSVRVDRGDRVRKGQILLTIEAAGARQQVAQARQAVLEAEEAGRMADEQKALADTTYMRYKRLHDEKAVADQEFDEVSTRRAVAGIQARRAGAALARAQAAFALAETYLGYATVRSPINGIVVEKKVDVGSMATPGAPLLVLEEPEYRVSVALDEHLRGKARPGMPLMVRVPGAALEETVPITQVTPWIDPMTRTFTVRARMPYSPLLQGGLYVKVLVPDGRKKAIMAPASAIGRRGELDFAYVVGKDGVLELRAVRTGSAYKNYVEVLSGLAPGDRVTVSDFDSLSQGLRLKAAR